MIAHNRKDYTNNEIGNFLIIGDTGETKRNQQMVLVRNKITGTLSTALPFDLIQSNGNGMHGLGQSRGNSTGYTGVVKRKNKYISEIGIEGVKYRLGTFLDPKGASEAYELALNDWLTNGNKPVIKKRQLPKGINISATGKYVATLMVNGKKVLNKTFETLPAAKSARKEAEQRYFKEKS